MLQNHKLAWLTNFEMTFGGWTENLCNRFFYLVLIYFSLIVNQAFLAAVNLIWICFRNLSVLSNVGKVSCWRKQGAFDGAKTHDWPITRDSLPTLLLLLIYRFLNELSLKNKQLWNKLKKCYKTSLWFYLSCKSFVQKDLY